MHIISLGAGVQSSAMAVMASKGILTPMPVCAFFADTKQEPKRVYEWLDVLENSLSFPVYRVSAGDLAETSTRLRVSEKTQELYLSHNIPAYTRNSDGTFGNYRRQCTDKHKLSVLRKAMLDFAGEDEVVCWIGISSDEIYRMKPSNHPKILNRWPLVEKQLNRNACLSVVPHAPRSACKFCPYKSNYEWRKLKEQEPEEFQQAVDYELALQQAARSVPRLDGIPFLHNSRVLLSEVDFSTEEERGQLNMFNNECEGMCGV